MAGSSAQLYGHREQTTRPRFGGLPDRDPDNGWTAGRGIGRAASIRVAICAASAATRATMRCGWPR